MVFKTTKINLGLSAQEIESLQLRDRINVPVTGAHRNVAITSRKGGIGKTTTTSVIGEMLAAYTANSVVAVDANPDAGSLGEKVPHTTDRTVRDLREALLLRDQDKRDLELTEVDQFINWARVRPDYPARHFGVLTSSEDPDVTAEFSEGDYRRVIRTLRRYFPITVTDTGTSVVNPIMGGILDLTDQLVIAASNNFDEYTTATKTLDWLERKGNRFSALARNSIVVVLDRQSKDVNTDIIIENFKKRTRAVFLVPYDAHLKAGGVLDIERLQPETTMVFLRVCAAIMDALAAPTP